MPPEAQYEQRPKVLFAYPQLSGSLAMPEMQLLLDRAFAGNAQLVKSARIWIMELLPGSEQSWLSETT